jgi:hypothetical protein
MSSAIRRIVLGLCGLAAIGALAGRAQAAPIFSTPQITPPAISPNGDNVQDEAVISYQIAVDFAEVRVFLGVPSGGIVDTLQARTTLARGTHALTFDGIGSSGPIPDGTYEVRLLGVGTGGEGTESLTLPLSIDRVPPNITEWTLSSGISDMVKNGSLLSMQVCIEGGFDSISVDLSAVDSNFNPALVEEDPLPDPCRLFNYTITAGNTRPDAAQLPVEVLAHDAAGNVSSASFVVCLSNHPPVVSRAATLQNEFTYFQNGDEIQALVGFSSVSPITVTGDFSNIDSQFDADSVRVTPAGGNLYLLRYRIRDFNTQPDGTYRVRLFAYDPGCGVAADSSVTISLDNAGINSSLVENFQANPNAFSPAGNGTKQVGITYTVLEDTLIVSVSTLAVYRDPTGTSRDTVSVPIQLSRNMTRGTHTVLWNGSFGSLYAASQLVDQNLTVVLRATSIALDRQRSLFTNLEVDNTPPILSGFPLSGAVQAQNGQTLNLPLTYDRSGYTLRADLRAVDSNFNPATSIEVVADSTGGKYGIFYAVSLTNTVLDNANLVVPVTATDRAGNTATVPSLIKVCLDNSPPQFVSAKIIDPDTGLENRGPFRNGDHIVIKTQWDSEAHQESLDVSADFSAVDDKFSVASHPATVIDRDSLRYEISYVLSTNNVISGSNLPVFVTARDRAGYGCGETRVTAVRITVDSKSGPAPVFDTTSMVVQSSPTMISGRATDADSVQILRSGTLVQTLAVDPATHRFSGQVTLSQGENQFTAKGFDLAGNVSANSAPLSVFLVHQTLLTVPPAFSPGSEFFVALLKPADAVTVHIYSLEGIEIQRLEKRGTGDVFHIPWDGTDHTGVITSSGPCLVAVEVEESGSVRERLHKAFIFRRTGTP